MSDVFVRVASLDEVSDGELHAVEASDGTRICLLNLGGEIRAVGDVCPHQGFPMSAGELHVNEGTVECAWHGARFDCRTGAVVEGPAMDELTVYEVRVDGDAVLVRTRAASGKSNEDG